MKLKLGKQTVELTNPIQIAAFKNAGWTVVPDKKDDKKEDAADEGDEKQPTPEEKEIEAVLKKAQERNDEHEAQKRARARKARLPPNERDW